MIGKHPKIGERARNEDGDVGWICLPPATLHKIQLNFCKSPLRRRELHGTGFPAKTNILLDMIY